MGKNVKIKNNSAIQIITYAIGAGTPVQVAPGMTTGNIALETGNQLVINPLLSTRPISIQTNGRVQAVHYGETTYNEFPTTFNIDVSGTPSISLTGTPDPVITVDYTNTTEPVIT